MDSFYRTSSPSGLLPCYHHRTLSKIILKYSRARVLLSITALSCLLLFHQIYWKQTHVYVPDWHHRRSSLLGLPLGSELAGVAAASEIFCILGTGADELLWNELAIRVQMLTPTSKKMPSPLATAASSLGLMFCSFHAPRHRTMKSFFTLRYVELS